MNTRKGIEPTVVLLSGGLDSATTLAIAKNEVGVESITTMSFDYNQRHNVEIQASRRISKEMGVIVHKQINIPDIFQSSALVDESIDIPEERSLDQMTAEIPTTYVPARNTLFLSYALSLVDSLAMENDTNRGNIYIGANVLDYSGYPDCREDYINAYEKMANLGTKTGSTGGRIIIRTPLIELSKKEIIEIGSNLNVPYELTISCYQADEYGRACGKCDSCLLRKQGFKDAGIPDPTIYQDSSHEGNYNIPF